MPDPTTTNSGGNGALTAVLVLVVIAIVGWVAFQQGVFTGDDNDTDINVELPDNNNGRY